MCLGTGEVVVLGFRGQGRGGGWMSRNSQHICAPLPPPPSIPIMRSRPVLRHLPQRPALLGCLGSSAPPPLFLSFLFSFLRLLFFPSFFFYQRTFSIIGTANLGVLKRALCAPGVECHHWTAGNDVGVRVCVCVLSLVLFPGF